MAKTYYGDVVRIYNHIIRGKYMGGVWRNPCAGFLMLSSHGGLVKYILLPQQLNTTTWV